MTNIEEVKEKLNVRVKGRKAVGAWTAFLLREPVSRYGTVSGIKKEDIGHENTYSWDISSAFSRGRLGPTPEQFFLLLKNILKMVKSFCCISTLGKTMYFQSRVV